MLKHATGNLIDLAEAGQFNVIVQGCNCFNTMGNGIAKEIKARYPAAFEADRLTDRGSFNKLGNYSVMLGKQFNIVNAYVQHGYNSGVIREDVFQYTAFELILQKLAHQYPGCHFGFPYIGCGLAGGNEEHVVDMLKEFAYDVAKSNGTVTLVRFG